MTSPGSSSILVIEEALLPPKPRFADGWGEVNAESFPDVSHSRNESRTSGTTASVGSLPNRNIASTTPVNPFSPPASVRSFSSPDHTPLTSPSSYFQRLSIPDMTPPSGIASVATSIVDVPHVYNSHPTTADSNSIPPSSFRLRESFASPPVRPLTSLSTAPPSVRLKRERAKSTMSIKNAPLSKPWLVARDPSARIAYFLTYGIMALGIIGGAIRCYFGWKGVSVMKGNLCVVFDEDFQSGEQGLFGENGKFFREVDMSGFG
jgi:hypothetical protein